MCVRIHTCLSSIIRLEKENIRVELDAELTNRFVINRAFAADKKSYPVRWMIVVVSVLSSLAMTLIVLLVLDSIKTAESKK